MIATLQMEFTLHRASAAMLDKPPTISGESQAPYVRVMHDI